MYLTGTISDLESRLHQLALNQDDIDDFIAEAAVWCGIYEPYMIVRWNRMIAKRTAEILQDPQYYLVPAISCVGDVLQDQTGDNITVNGETITV